LTTVSRHSAVDQGGRDGADQGGRDGALPNRSVRRDNDHTPVDIAVVILTFNESIHIARAINSVRPFCKEIFVIDSYSTDDTVAISTSAGAIVLQNKFVNQSKQFAWGLENSPITAEWIMRLDADEVVEPELADEIRQKLNMIPADVAGINIDRRHVFMGRWIRYGGRFPLTLLRIWRRGQGRIEDRWMDEHIVVSGGRMIKFSGHFSDVNLNDLTYFTSKHNAYATREAIDVLIKKYQLKQDDEVLSAGTASTQAAIKRCIKELFYNKIPFGVSSFLYFLFRYIFQLGFLDGRPGFIYHYLQGYWYRFLVGAKVSEFEKELADLPTSEDRLRRLSQLSGYSL
jgi:glycosyltransferase involved in cell wall biosynthesis